MCVCISGDFSLTPLLSEVGSCALNTYCVLCIHIVRCVYKLYVVGIYCTRGGLTSEAFQVANKYLSQGSIYLLFPNILGKQQSHVPLHPQRDWMQSYFLPAQGGRKYFADTVNSYHKVRHSWGMGNQVPCRAAESVLMTRAESGHTDTDLSEEVRTDKSRAAGPRRKACACRRVAPGAILLQRLRR